MITHKTPQKQRTDQQLSKQVKPVFLSHKLRHGDHKAIGTVQYCCLDVTFRGSTLWKTPVAVTAKRIFRTSKPHY